MADKYDDYDWAELPEDIQEAFMVLGYNGKLWDKDKAPPTDDLDWDELTKEQQEAAKKVGYTEKTWNES